MFFSTQREALWTALSIVSNSCGIAALCGIWTTISVPLEISALLRYAGNTFFMGGGGGLGLFMKKIKHIFPFSIEYNLFLQKSCKYILSANQKCVSRNSVVTVLFGCNNKMCCYLAVLKWFAFSYCKWAANLIVTTKEHCNYNLWHLQHFVCRTCGICSIMYAGLAAFCMQD